MMLSDEVKLYEVVEPQLKSSMWILKNSTCSKSTDSITTLIMLDSPMNLYTME
jgi:hypothetical protein